MAQRTLDDYWPVLEGRRLLLKIDVEGAELGVLRGAADTLARARPVIILESFARAARDELFALLAGCGYALYRLPWSPADPGVPLGAGEFRGSGEVNFMAMAG